MKFFNSNLLATHIGLVIFLLVCRANSEKIIFFHHLASYSHRVQTWPLAEALAKKGHEVTYISPFHPKQPNPNITELVPKDFSEFITNTQATEFDLNLKINGEMLNMIDFVFDMGVSVCELLYTSPEIKDWLKANPKADLVVIDNCFPECGTGLAYKLGAKHIYFTVVPFLATEYDNIGTVPQASAIPEVDNSGTLTPPFSFFERISNAIESLRWRWQHYHYSKRLDYVIRTSLSVPEMPYIESLVRNTSLIFHTSDVISDYPRSLPPLYVDIAGIHVNQSTKPLPQEMEDFINSKTSSGEPNDGFIYISLGSMIVSSNLPQHIKDIFFDVIKSFPKLKFLWKWDGDFPQEIPTNLYLSKWFPQADILGHPKAKGFITQCGRPSLMEALYNAIPMIAIPIVADQELNADRLKEMGAAVRLDIAKFNYNVLKDGVQKVAYDSSMKARVSRLREIFLDRPMSPLDTALWWTDYVLKNEDTSHLRPVGNDQFWFVRRNVDVWATLSIFAFLICVGFTIMVWKLVKLYLTPSKMKHD